MSKLEWKLNTEEGKVTTLGYDLFSEPDTWIFREDTEDTTETLEFAEKELADLAQEMVPATQQLQIAITKLGLAFAPLIEIVGSFFSLLASGISTLDKFGILDFIIIAFTMLAGILAFVALEFSVVAAKAIIANGALLAAKLGVDLTTVSFISLGSAIKQSLGIIGLAAAAFGLLIAIFGKSGAPIAGVIAGITAQLLFLLMLLPVFLELRCSYCQQFFT